MTLPGLEPGLRDWKPVTNRLCYVMSLEVAATAFFCSDGDDAYGLVNMASTKLAVPWRECFISHSGRTERSATFVSVAFNVFHRRSAGELGLISEVSNKVYFC